MVLSTSWSCRSKGRADQCSDIDNRRERAVWSKASVGPVRRTSQSVVVAETGLEFRCTGNGSALRRRHFVVECAVVEGKRFGAKNIGPRILRP
jgi:hypothetical protein